MKGALLLLCLGPSIAAQNADSQQIAAGRSTGREHAFVEISTPQTTYFIQEPIELRLRVGVETQFLRDNLIQPFRNKLDVPVQVAAPWLSDLPGTVVLQGTANPDGRKRLSFVLNDNLSRAVQVEDRRIGGRQFTVFQIESSYLADQPGPLEIPGPVLRFAHATSFREDFVTGRVPEDPQDSVVQAEPLTLTIEPLPEEGRPPGFTGAVGQFTLRAETDTRDLEAGESFKLLLHIEGQGNMEFLEVPQLDGLAGFHVYGKIEDIQRTTRTVTYDLAPLSADVTEVPAIPFSYFDPEPPAGYRTVSTEPIPLEVRPLAGGAQPPIEPSPSEPTGSEPVPGEDDIYDLKPVQVPDREPARSLSPVLVVVVLLAPWLVVLGIFYRRRARRQDQVDPDDLRARGAAAAFRARDPSTHLDKALAEFLAAHLRCRSAAVISPALPEHLASAGVPRELADRTARLLDDLVDARFGGEAPGNSAETARDLVDALDASFQRTGETL